MFKLKYLIIIATAANLLFQPSSFSMPTQSVGSCPTEPYPISNSLSRGVQTIFGLNFITKKIVESALKNQLSQLAKGDFNVNVETYSAGDLFAGKFKNFDIEAKNINANDIFISYFQLKSFCDFIHIDYKTKKDSIIIVDPALIGFQGTITEDDLNKTISSPTYKEMLSKVKISIYGKELGLVEFDDSKIKINNNKIILSTNVRLLGAPQFMKIPVKIGTGLKVTNNKIKLSNSNVSSNSPFGSINLLTDFIENFHPTVFDVSSIEQNGMKINFKTLSINKNAINFDGTVWLPANYSPPASSDTKPIRKP